MTNKKTQHKQSHKGRKKKHRGGQPQATCDTHKDSEAQRAFRAGGVIAAAFFCGIVATPRRFYISESLRQVMTYFERMQSLNASLSLIGYDDWCHLSAYIQRHGPSALRKVRGFIDRWHMRGHTRFQCWTKFCAENYQDLWEFFEKDVTSGNVAALLVDLQEEEMLQIDDFDTEAVPTMPPSRVAAELLDGSLPLELVFSEYTHPQVDYTIRVQKEGGRRRVLLALNRSGLSLKYPLQKGRGWNAPSGAKLFSVHATHRRNKIAGFPQEVLRTMLVERCQARTVRVTLRRRRWTSVLERQWRVFNVLKHSLSFVSPCVFDFLLLHAVDINNQSLCASRKRRSQELSNSAIFNRAWTWQ